MSAGDRLDPVTLTWFRFIFATGYGEGAHPDEFMDVPTITKPYSIEQIRDTLARLA